MQSSPTPQPAEPAFDAAAEFARFSRAAAALSTYRRHLAANEAFSATLDDIGWTSIGVNEWLREAWAECVAAGVRYLDLYELDASAPPGKVGRYDSLSVARAEP